MATRLVSSPTKLPRWLIWLLLGLAAVAIGFGIWSLPLAQWAQALQVWIDGMGALGPLAFCAAYVIAAVLLIPVWPLSITGGLAFGLWGFAWVPIAATLGACAAFVVSRYFARGRIRAWLADRPRSRAVDEAIGEEGWKVVFLLRLSPLVPYNLMNYFCGMSRVRFLPYLLATFAGSVPVTALYVYLGYVGQSVAGGKMGMPQWIMLGVGIVATAVVTILIGRKIRPKLERNRAASAAAPEGSR